MKRTSQICFVVFVVTVGVMVSTPAQDVRHQEEMIRRLDLEAANAVLNKDEKLIARFFARNSLTNNPRNGLTRGSDGVIEAARTNVIDYHSFDRVIESVQILGTTAVVMGNEVVVTKAPNGGAGETIRRRYTNVWMKAGKDWRIVARHASVICR